MSDATGRRRIGAVALVILTLLAAWYWWGADDEPSRAERSTAEIETPAELTERETQPDDAPAPAAQVDSKPLASHAVVRIVDTRGREIGYASVGTEPRPDERSTLGSTNPPEALIRIEPARAVGELWAHAAGYQSRQFMPREGLQEIELLGGADLEVRVIDAEDAGVPDATVTIGPSWSERGEKNTTRSAKTNGAGIATVRGLSGQTWFRVTAKHADFGTSTALLRPKYPGPIASSVEITLVPDGVPHLAGRVLREGRPVAGAIVEALQSRDKSAMTTDENGRFELMDCPSGQVRLRIRPDLTDVERIDWFVPRLIRLELPRAKPLRIDVQRGRVVTVVVTDAAGQPLKRIPVMHADIGSYMGRVTIFTDATGKVLFGGVANEAAEILVSQNGIMERVRGPPGDTQVRVIVRPLRVLTGVVVDSMGNPVAGVSVRSPGFLRRQTTDAAGRFRSENTVPGRGVILVDAGDRSATHDYTAQDTDLRIVLPD